MNKVWFLWTIIILGLGLLSGCSGEEKVKQVDVNKLQFIALKGIKIARFYDQRTNVLLKNTSNKKMKVRVGSESPADLMTGFVGRGSNDWYDGAYVELGPGETWRFRFIIHANQAVKSKYDIPVIAFSSEDGKEWTEVARNNVPVEIAKPELKLEVSWRNASSRAEKARMIKYLVVTNHGVRIPDFSVSTMAKLEDRITMFPQVKGLILEENEQLEIRIQPRLYLGFHALEGIIHLSGHNAVRKVQYSVAIPEGQQVFAAITRSTSVSGSSGDRCTNQSSASYSMSAPQGTGPFYGGDSSSGGGIGGQIATITPRKKPKQNNSKKDDEDEEEGEFLSIFDIIKESPAEREQENEALAEGADKATRGTKGTIPATSLSTDNLTHQDMINEPGIGGVINGTGLQDPNITFRYGSELQDGDNGLKEIVGRVITSDDLNRLSLPKGDRLAQKLKKYGYSREDMKDPDKRRDFIKRWMRDRESDPNVLIQNTTKLIDQAMSGFAKEQKEMVVSRSGNQADMLIHRKVGGRSSLDFIPINGPSKTLRAPVALSNWGRSIHSPTLARDKSGNPVAAFTQENDQGGSDVVVVSPSSGKRFKFDGKGGKQRNPQLVEGNDSTDILWLEKGAIKQANLSKMGEITPKSQTLVSGVDQDSSLQAMRLKDGGLALMYKKDGQMVEQKLGQDEGGTLAMLMMENPKMATSKNGQLVRFGQQTDGTIIEQNSNSENAMALTPKGWKIESFDLLKREDDSLRLSVHRKGKGHFIRDRVNGIWQAWQQNIQPEEPILDAVAVVDFKLPWNRAHYKLMNTTVSVNGFELGKIEGRVPNGRYAFPIPVGALQYRASYAGKNVKNTIDLKIKGIGQGNFHITDLAEIYTRHQLIQDFVISKNQMEAQELADLNTSIIRHDTADLMVTSDYWEPPRDAKPGQTMMAVIGLINLGDKAVEGGTLIAKAGGRKLAQVNYKLLPPFKRLQLKVPVTIPPTWNQDHVFTLTFYADLENDPTPYNNSLTFGVFGTPDPDLLGPVAPVAIEAKRLTGDGMITVTRSGEYPINNSSHWYKVAVKKSGHLLFEMSNVPNELPVVVDLFDAKGKAITATDGISKVKGNWVYLRIGLRPDTNYPSNAKVAIGWQ